MKLFASILTTTAIVGAIWGATLLQPTEAYISPEKQHTENRPSTAKQAPQPKPRLISKIYLRTVVSKTVSLDTVDLLWEDFESQLPEQQWLPEKFDRIIVLYQDINKDFTRARVTIGFPLEATTQAAGDRMLPDSLRSEQLLSRGNYSKAELATAWEEINFIRAVEAIVETHYLNVLGQDQASQLVVYYK